MSMGSTVKTFRVLEKLCKDGPAKASTISQELGLNKSSVHRFLNLLQDMGYVCQIEKNGLYAATLKMFEIGVQVKNRIGIARIAEPIMRQLHLEVQEAVNLGVFIDFEMSTLERILPNKNGTHIIIKTRLPAYCTAFGKMILAHMDKDAFEEYIQQIEFVPYTSRTVQTAAQLRQMIKKVQEDGVAIDDRELDNNIRSIAGPIFNENGYVIAALSVTGAVTSMVGDHFEDIKNKLLLATTELSELMGFEY